MTHFEYFLVDEQAKEARISGGRAGWLEVQLLENGLVVAVHTVPERVRIPGLHTFYTGGHSYKIRTAA